MIRKLREEKQITMREKHRDAKEVAAIAVGTGRNGRARWFTIWKRIERKAA